MVAGARVEAREVAKVAGARGGAREAAKVAGAMEGAKVAKVALEEERGAGGTPGQSSLWGSSGTGSSCSPW